MHFSEAAKKSGFFGKDYAAIVSIALVDESSLIPELGDLRAALIQWTGVRGRSAKTILITLVGPSTANEWSEEMLLAVFEDDPELSSIAKSSDVRVSILNKGQTPARQFRIAG